MKNIINSEFNEHISVAKNLYKITDSVETAAKLCIDCLRNERKIILFGNGGSAADAQHIAAELVGRYKTKRKGIPAIAITTDSSILTSIANDFGYSNVFERQIEAIANNGDVAIGISTSGQSINVINGLKIAAKLNCKTIGLTGSDGGKLNDLCNVNIASPSKDTARIQEMHIVIGHTICHLIDKAFNSTEGS